MEYSASKAHSFLKKISGSNTGKIYPLFSTLSTIGRAAHNTLCISEPFLSRKHCSIRYEDSNWIITDYGGLNGTYLNGKKMESSGYRVLKDKTIVFLGDPEESTCGFIFLTSLPVSSHQAESAGSSTSSSSVVHASDPGPSSSPDLPSLSALFESGDPAPDQSDDVSSTRSVLSAENVTESPIRMVTNLSPNRLSGYRRAKLRKMTQRRRDSSLNDRIVPNSYDASTSRGDSQPDNRLRIRRMSKLRQMMIQRRSNTLSPLNDRMLPIFYDASTTSPISTSRSNTDLIYPFLPSLATSRNYPVLPTSPNREVISIDVPDERVSKTNPSEQAGTSSSVPRTFSSEAGSSRGNASNPPEFDVLDMLVDSFDSDRSDSDCSISSMDSLRTRIRKQKLKSNRALADGGNLSLDNSPPSLLIEEPMLMPPGLLKSRKSQTKVKSELESQNFQDSESLIQNIEDGVKDCVTKLGDEDWMCASKVEESDTIQYLKDRVLKLQKNVMDATEELKNALEKNKEQQAIIQDLLDKQGVSREQLSGDLESELSCNICTEVLIKPVILDCGHIFCQYCIGVWKKKKRQCPNCRDPIKTENEVRVLEGYLSKVVEHLEPMYRMKRNELIESRKTETVKLKKSSRKRTPSYRVAAALGAAANPNIIPELRMYHRLQNSNSTRHNLTVRLRHLTNQRAENPLLRRLVDRIERGTPLVTPP